MLSSDPEEFQAQAVEVGRVLSAAWREYWGKGQELHSGHLAQNSLGVVAGLAVHVDKLAEQGFNLIEQGEWLVAMPIVRSAYECAIRAQWINQVPDGGDGFFAEDSRQVRNYAKTLSQATSATMRDAAGKISHRIVEEYGDPFQQARRFDLACSDLEPGGADAYAIYRAMSHFSHPSVLLVDQYLEDRGDSVRVRSRAESGGGPVWAGMLAASLVWATAVVEFHARDKAFRSAVRSAATELSVEFVLKMSDDARRRNSQAKP